MQSIAWNITDVCTISELLRLNPWLRLIAALNIVVSVLSVVVLWLFLRSRGMRKAFGIISANLKIIVVVGIFYYFLCVFWSAGLYTYKLVTMFINGSDCYHVWRGLNCYFAYTTTASVCVVGNSLFHLALLIERTVATFSKSKSRSSSALGWILGAIMVVMPNYYNLVRDYSVHMADRSYCGNIISRAEAQAKSTTMNNIKGLLVADLLITFGDLLLYVYNKYEKAKYRRRISDNYTLNKSFNLREFEITISLILPFSLFHSLGYFTQLIWFVQYVNLIDDSVLDYSAIIIELLNLFRVFYILVLAVCLWIFNVHKTKDSRSLISSHNAETYFLEFKRMIA